MSALLGQIVFDGSVLDNRSIQSESTLKRLREERFSIVDRASSYCFARREGTNGRAGDFHALVDGRLHDAINLRTKLGAAEDASDADLVARAWGKWGEEAVDKLLGDFAVVLHDAGKRRVALIRDHIGTRPLYWHWAAGRLTFATFIPDLLALLPSRPGPNLGAVAAYLRYPIVIGSHTMFKGVHVVLPGQMLLADASGFRVVRWWRPENAAEIRFRHPAEYAAAFRTIVERAVADRLPTADLTVGSHLSGGIDSTGVALIAQKALKENGQSLRAVYSWSPVLSPEAPDMGQADERPRIHKICAEAGLNVRFGTLPAQVVRDALARPFEEEGLADLPDEISTLDQAMQDGVRVLLSGWGGDEAFSTHALGVPAWMLSQWRFGSLLRLARARGGFRRPDRMVRFFWSHGIVFSLPDRIFHRFSPAVDVYGDGCYLSCRLATTPLLDGLPKRLRYSADPRRDMRNMLERHHIAERMATWAVHGARSGIEYRYPLTDRRVLDFMLGISPEILWGDGQPRYLARASMKGRLRTELSKADPANERKRLSAFRGAWHLLAQEVALGLFDADCPWLDMPALRRDIARGPSGDTMADLIAFARIMSAVRIWHMAGRFGALEGSVRQSQG